MSDRDHTARLAAALLWDRFCHRTDDYALQRSDGSYRRADQALTPELLEQHAQGKVTVGVYQVRGSTVRWICLDIDGLHGEPEKAEPAARVLLGTFHHFGLEPIAEWSGSKGYHLWLLTEEIEASLARSVAQGLIGEVDADDLVGTQEVAVFPKQVSVNGSQPYGNLVKLPFGVRADNGKRGVILDSKSLARLPAATQLEVVSTARLHTAAQLRELAEENNWLRNSGRVPARLNQGQSPPPCWAYILDTGVDEGHRDNVVYSLAKIARRQGMSAPMVLPILNIFDQRMVRPPLGLRTIEQKIASAFKGGMSIGCENIQSAGLCPAMNGVHCPIYGQRKEEVSEYLPDENLILAGFSIEPLSILKSDPPKYRATVNGTEVELSLIELTDFRRFKVSCVAKLQFVPVLPIRKNSEGRKIPDQLVWEQEILNPALQSVVTYEDAPPDASLSGAVWDNVLLFLRESRCYENRDDVYDDHLVLIDDVYLFRGRVLRNWLTRNKLRTIEEHELWAVVRNHGGDTSTLRTRKGVVRVWQIPAASGEAS